MSNMAASKRKASDTLDENENEFVTLVKRRTKELYNLKTGKVSETPRNPETNNNSDVVDKNRDVVRMSGNLGANPEGNEILNIISKMEDNNRKTMEKQAEVIANLSVHVLTLQDKFGEKKTVKEKGNDKVVTEPKKAVTVEHELSDISDEESSIIDEDDNVEIDIDNSLDKIIEDSNDEPDKKDDAFFAELEKEYEEEKKFGPKIDEAIAKLAESAIEKVLKDDDIQKLTDKYLIPENCKKIKVPLVNKELWAAFKNKRECDVAVQRVTKTCSTSLVMVLKALELIKNKGEVDKMKEIFRDLFKILTNGICLSNRNRKRYIRPAVPAKYRRLCEVDTPVTEFLFGDNLDEKVDQMDKDSKRSDKLKGKDDRFLGKSSKVPGKFPRNYKIPKMGNPKKPYVKKDLKHGWAKNPPK